MKPASGFRKTLGFCKGTAARARCRYTPAPANAPPAMSREPDPAAEALWLPLAERRLEWPADGALFLRARLAPALRDAPRPGLQCEQSFRPEAQALEEAGFALADSADDRRYALVLLLPPRQRDEARALYARALARLAPGGRIVACVANTEGAKSSEGDLARLVGPLTTLSKHKCRVFWSAPLEGPLDTALCAQWAQLDAPRPVAGGRFVSRPGVFAWDRIDPASQLLVDHLPTDLAGRAADLGAGYGFLAAELLTRCPGIQSLDVIEAEQRALTLAEQNLAAFAGRATLRFLWQDVARGLADSYDVIVCNPPFHAQGRADRPDIGKAFLRAARAALAPRGRLWVVANRHLPYEVQLQADFAQVRTVATQGGFKVIEARR